MGRTDLHVLSELLSLKPCQPSPPCSLGAVQYSSLVLQEEEQDRGRCSPLHVWQLCCVCGQSGLSLRGAPRPGQHQQGQEFLNPFLSQGLCPAKLTALQQQPELAALLSLCNPPEHLDCVPASESAGFKRWELPESSE